MKKIFLFLTVCATVVLFTTSCTKEFTCECTTTIDGVVMGTTTVTGEGKSGKEVCDAMDTESTVLGIVTKMDCEAK